MKLRISLAIALFSAFSAAASAQVTLDTPDSQDADKLHIEVSPYLWMAGVNGTLGIGQRQVDFDYSFADIIKNFKFGLMGLTEVRKGHVVFLSDFMWLKIGNEKVVADQNIPISANLQANMNTFMWDNEIGYRGVDKPKIKLDALVGARYWHLSSGINGIPVLITPHGGDVTLQTLNVSSSDNFADPVMGLRTQFAIYKKLGGFVKADIGGYGVSSNLTAQVVAGIGVPIKKFALDAGYRRIYLNRSNGDQSVKVTFEGIFVGGTFGLK